MGGGGGFPSWNPSSCAAKKIPVGHRFCRPYFLSFHGDLTQVPFQFSKNLFLFVLSHALLSDVCRSEEYFDPTALYPFTGLSQH